MTGITGWLAGVLITGMLCTGTALAASSSVMSLGQNAAAVSGSVKGSQVRDYRFEGREGEQVRLTVTGHPAAYFLLWNDEQQTMPIAETRDWMGVLPADGSYVVRVFVYRSHAEKGERADYRLRVQRLGKVKGSDRK
ncbi:MAG: hypothetical protein KBE71_03350 [Laribacter sp.]|nr:hypothetical protein [Laribacter sp.]MBP9527384.1 hypothetical protein [Laribacter sp.]